MDILAWKYSEKEKIESCLGQVSLALKKVHACKFFFPTNLGMFSGRSCAVRQHVRSPFRHTRCSIHTFCWFIHRPAVLPEAPRRLASQPNSIYKPWGCASSCYLRSPMLTMRLTSPSSGDMALSCAMKPLVITQSHHVI